ncbi:hypothetical protein CDIK_4398, partial [Cucumispora dikerogammari]
MKPNINKEEQSKASQKTDTDNHIIIDEKTSNFLSNVLSLTNRDFQQHFLSLISQNRLSELKQYFSIQTYNKILYFFNIKNTKKDKTQMPLRVIDRKIIDDTFISKLIKKICGVTYEPHIVASISDSRSEDTLSKRNYRYIEKPAHNKNNKHKYNRNFDC